MTETSTDPIHLCLERWHQHTRGQLEGGFDAILHPDVEFLSPVVFTPQKGIEVTKLYLTAAGGTLGGDAPTGAGHEAEQFSGSFRYKREIASGHDAVLEFETTMEGKYVNGVDLITCDDDSMITEFKVMLRPLQAVNLVHAQMGAMLDKLNASS